MCRERYPCITKVDRMTYQWHHCRDMLAYKFQETVVITAMAFLY